LQFDSNNYVYAVGIGGGSGTDWTDTEKQQIRHRLGIDGEIATPNSNTPHLGTMYPDLDQLASHGDSSWMKTTPGEIWTHPDRTITDKTGFRLSEQGIDDIWNELQSGHTTEGTFGYYLNARISDCSTFDPVTQGVFLTPNSSNAVIAGAVWSAVTTNYNEQGTFGAKLQSLDTTKLDVAVSTRLAAEGYEAPDNESITAIKEKTDKLTFNEYNYVYAIGVGDGGGEADWTENERKQIRYRLGIDGETEAPQSNLPHLDIAASVVVQPLSVQPATYVPDGGSVEAFRYARIRASWLIRDTNLEGHDLHFLVYDQLNPSTPIAHCHGSDISVEVNEGHSLVRLDASERDVQSGVYSWVLRDQTTDVVLLHGRFIMRAVPDVPSP